MKLLPQLLQLRQDKWRNDRLSFFRPWPKQLPFFQSQARGRAIVASNQFGKTTCGGVEASYWALGRHPYRKVPESTFGWVVSLDFVVQRDVIQPELQKFLPPERIALKTYRTQDVWDRIVLTCPRCGAKPRETGARKSAERESWFCPSCRIPASVIGFKSQDQGRLKFQGVKLDWVWEDEEGEQGIHQELMLRLVAKKGSWWATYTPVEGQTWSYDEIFTAQKPGELEVFEGSLWDNYSISREEVKRIEDSITDPIMRDIRIYGKYRTLSGLIFKMWDPKLNEVEQLPREFLNHDGTIQEYFDIYCGIDTGRHFAATFWLVDFFGNVWGFDEYFSEGQSTHTNAEAIKAICRKWGVWPEFFLDASSQFEVDLGEEGIPCSKNYEMVDVGIQVMVDYIVARKEGAPGPRMIVIAPNMPGWCHERLRYQWAPAPKTGPSTGQAQSKPLKKNDHRLDSSRYIVALRPVPSVSPAGGEVKSIQQRIHDRVVEKVLDREMQKEAEMGGDDNY